MATQLRESFNPLFVDSSFELKYPEVDSSFRRRLANEKKEFPKRAPDICKVEAQEKSLLSAQCSVLDIGRPLLLIAEQVAQDDELKKSPITSATDAAL